jgi:uncharacterized protein involved in type VI secretion and phage assembly
VVHTDRDHRIKEQFHWQRNAGDSDLSHSRLNRPCPASHTGAPADDRAGTWVRIATPLAPIAGANWGAVAVPRVGSEVLIDFMDGNIDRPVVIGSLYNGKGQVDAQHNQAFYGAGVATGNAPAWFPGESGAHAHPAALSGIKTQAMGASQSGNGAYNQLVFDDSAGQPRVALQSHASQHTGTAELNLGAASNPGRHGATVPQSPISKVPPLSRRSEGFTFASKSWTRAASSAVEAGVTVWASTSAHRAISCRLAQSKNGATSLEVRIMIEHFQKPSTVWISISGI